MRISHRFGLCVVALFALALLLGTASCKKDDADDESKPTRGLPADVGDDDTGAGSDDDADDDSTTGTFCSVDEALVDDIVSRMTVREMVAARYVVGVHVLPDFDLDDSYRWIHDLGVGGVIIQPGTILPRPQWTIESINKLQGYALSRENPIPLFVATDQEGGIPQAVSNLTGGTDTPGNMGLGAAFDSEATGTSYDLMAAQLYELGINNAYAPVLDLQLEPAEVSMYTRCFGEDPALIAENADAAVRASSAHRIIATAKHFPGHGTAPGDEHAGLTINTADAQTVRDRELVPFQAAIDAGVDMIMTTHAAYAAWDPDRPASLNRDIVTGLLRDEMGYEGLIVTDDIDMGAISQTPLPEHPDIMAFDAGNDLLLDVASDDPPPYGINPANLGYTYNLAEQIEVATNAVFSGRLSYTELENSVRRILRTKMKYCLFDEPYRKTKGIKKRINTPAQIGTAFDLHQRALTVVRASESLPLSMDDDVYVASIAPVQDQMYPGAFWPNASATSLLWEMHRINPAVRGRRFGLRPPAQERTIILNELASDPPDVVVFGTYDADSYAEQADLVNAVLDLGFPTVVVALATPYDFTAFPDVDAYWAAYSNRDLSLINTARALYGLAETTGRLPVAIPGYFDAGWSDSR